MSDLQKLLKEHAKDIVDLGKKHGCSFSEDDVAALADGQLTEDELGSVQGGTALPTGTSYFLKRTDVKL